MTVTFEKLRRPVDKWEDVERGITNVGTSNRSSNLCGFTLSIIEGNIPWQNNYLLGKFDFTHILSDLHAIP
ncbi:Protein of unknown function [Gryllus bimaculatus]|nr:Protein of unknown function [Gryllus bimaculatus]